MSDPTPPPADAPREGLCVPVSAPEGENGPMGVPAFADPSDGRTAAPSLDVDALARMLSAADVEINHGDYPTWDDLAESGEAQYRQMARYLLARCRITPTT